MPITNDHPWIRCTRPKITHLPPLRRKGYSDAEKAELILAVLPEAIQKYLLSFVVAKFNWWNFRGDWRLGEYMAHEGSHNFPEYKDFPSDAETYELSYVVGHHVTSRYQELVFVYWKLFTSEGSYHYPQPSLISLKEAWSMNPDAVWSYYMTYILRIRDLSEASRVTWYTNRYVWRKQCCMGPFNIKVESYFTIPNLCALEFEKSLFRYQEYFGVKRYLGMSLELWYEFGRSSISVKQLLFHHAFTGDKLNLDLLTCTHDERNWLSKKFIYGLRPMEYHLMRVMKKWEEETVDHLLNL